ncbi:MAG TPA: hypothetical protein VJ574_05300 [Candidatus Bathyarchaeia archaeon]|nr:hypothetical protein [Candidatus Bathyarchaeia archaeon]
MGEVEYTKSRGIGIIHIAIAAMWGAIGMVLDYLATFITIGYGITTFYPGAAAMAIGGMWHGPWAALGFYFGNITGGILGGGVIPVQLLGTGPSAAAEALIPFLAFRFFKANPGLKNWKDWGVFIAFAAVIPMVATATWYVLVNLLFGIITMAMVPPIWLSWMISSTVTILVLSPPILIVGTPAAMKNRGYVRGWLT